PVQAAKRITLIWNTKREAWATMLSLPAAVSLAKAGEQKKNKEDKKTNKELKNFLYFIASQ
ncbi:MAG: hypothetical protein PHW14_04745, partial [Candidatus Omnitrophica bacterium]|nr:hypothetical protein [Candidatus Omnitrophota bacterium]